MYSTVVILLYDSKYGIVSDDSGEYAKNQQRFSRNQQITDESPAELFSVKCSAGNLSVAFHSIF